jgi:flavorubredoxin
MPIVDAASETRVEEVADGVFQIHVPVTTPNFKFSFNQYLVVDDEPLMFHTGGRRIFPLVRAGIAHVMPIEKLRHVVYSHFESDECGAMNDILALAPHATPTASFVGSMVNADVTDRPTRGLQDGEAFSLGKKRVRFLATPHLPHGWDCGYMFEETTRTLLCGDLFTQGDNGEATPAIAKGDILEPSEGFRKRMDYFSHGKQTRALMEKVASTEPTTLACMHGSAWKGDGAKLLRALADRLV